MRAAGAEAPTAGPTLVLADGATRSGVAIITEAMAGRVAGPAPTQGASNFTTPMTVDCRSAGQPVSPTIFGIAFADAPRDLGATAHRWGGNMFSRYNWRLGNAANTTFTWYWENTVVDSYEVFVDKAAQMGGLAAITVPMIGWVAKDTTSASFPVDSFGSQEKTDPYHPEFGNGVRPDGKTPIPPGDPTRTSVKMGPDEIGQWVATIRQSEAKRGRHVVYEYILDNEPALWNSTHRDVHPEPVTYDELLERTLAYGTAIRKADPEAIIAGPAAWGWPEYNFSAKDVKEGFFLRPDRRAHGDMPLLAWYLQKLAEYEKRSGVRVLDVLDVHLYPQADGVQTVDGKGGAGAGNTDRKTNDLRYRVTRSLWDRNYVDESWIKDAVYLIPRMKDLIAQYYPGRALQIGEYNFGGEDHPAGGVALAEALGRFALFGVSHAFYWTHPPKPSAAYWAFRAYRNYDGNGGHFLERIVPSSSPLGTSVFASRDEAGKKWVLVALNFKADRAEDAHIELSGCGEAAKVRSFVYTGEDQGFVGGEASVKGGTLSLNLPPTSISVVEWSMP